MSSGNFRLAVSGMLLVCALAAGVTGTGLAPRFAAAPAPVAAPPATDAAADTADRAAEGDLLEKAKQYRVRARGWFGDEFLKLFPNELRRAELSVMYPLFRPGLRQADVLALMGEPDDERGYMMSQYCARLIFSDGRLTDDVRGLYSRAGSKYHEINKVRALQRLAELRTLDGVAERLESGDQGIDTARALALLHDRRAVPLLIKAARKAAFIQSGSESATIHGIYQYTLSQTLASLTGLEVALRGWAQDPEGLEKAADRAAAWWKKHEAEVMRPANGDWGERFAGLRIQVVADRKRCRPGQSADLTVRLENVGAKPLVVCKHPAFYSRFLSGPRGAEVPPTRELVEENPRLPAKADLVTLQPGKTFEVRLGTFDAVIEDGSRPTGWRATTRPNRPGSYRLRVHYCGTPGYGSADLRSAWAGVLTSNSLTIQCRRDE